MEESAFDTAYALISAQRNLRILGIFARSALRDGKRDHIPKLPRVFGHLKAAVQHPVFSGTGAELLSGLPDPELAFPDEVRS